ncbi:MAG: DMT family transporter [Burkholderiaceae bacterium]
MPRSRWCRPAGHFNATAPLFGAVVATLWIGERMGPVRVLGLLVGFAGVLVLVWGNVTLADGGVQAVVLMLGVSMCWAFAANYSRLRLQAIDPVVVTAGNTLLAMFVMVPLAVPLWPEQMPSTRAWVEIAFLGSASSAGGMLLYFRLLRSVGTIPTMSVTFLSPVVAVVSGALYLGEAITLQTIAGGAVVLLGTALVLGLYPKRRVPADGGPVAAAPGGPREGQ